MKIIVASFYLPPTDRIGAGVQMHMLANAYVDLGHDVTVISPSMTKDEKAKYELVSVRLVGRNRIVQWAEFLRDYAYSADIVHFGGDDHLVKNRDQGVQIRTYHGSCFAEAIVAKSVREKVRMFYLGCTELLSQKRWRITTTVSRSTNRYFLRPNIVIPNGVDLSKFLPSACKSYNPSILFVGTLDSRKRGRKLVEEFIDIIRPKIPHAELWIVRDNTIVNFDGVTVYGSVSETKLIELYQKAWVFCLPSSYEGFGVPYIEAMACGTPVVATPNPGALEVLDHGQYGLLTEIDQLGNTLVSLLSDDQRRAEMTQNGLTRAREYDLHEIAEKYIGLANDFVKKSVGR
jgi:phosphatidylinositol alpha-mannosyltransferase